ncbi:MAG: hypothetical protein KKH98_00350 [Spirochaetes bacterium]|nr:hypothetical protein [Spirochaetota bacterium]
MPLLKYKLVGKEYLDSPTKHLAIPGLSGRGKDMFGEGYITQKIGKTKVIDFHSVERFEGFFYGIPQTDAKLIERMNMLSHGIMRPTTFNNEIILFCGKRLLNIHKKRVPKNISIFTLDKNDLTNEELIDFLGKTTAAKEYVNLILYANRDKVMNIDDMENLLIDIIQTPGKDREPLYKGMVATTLSILLRNIALIKSSGLFSDAFPKLNIKKLVENKKVISTISCFLQVSHIERAIVLSVVLKKMIKYRYESNKKIPLTLYIREMQTFYKKEYDSEYSLIRDMIRDVLEQGRDSLITLVCNFQIFKQLPSDIANQFSSGKVFSFALPLKEGEKLLNYAPIPKMYLAKLQMCSKGQGMYVVNGMFRYLMEVIPTRHMKKTEGFDVWNHLGAAYGWNNYEHLDYGGMFGG